MQSKNRTAAGAGHTDDGKAETEAQASTTDSMQDCTTDPHRGQWRVERLLPARAENVVSPCGKKEGMNGTKAVLLAQAA